MNWLISYIKEAQAELAKVSWPTRQKAVNLSIAVIIFSVALATFIGLIDWVFSQVLQKLILKV